MLSNAQLTSLAKDFAKTFTTLATVKRITRGSDELGDDAASTETTIGTVKGWLSSSPTPQATLDGGVVTANTYRFVCAADADIQPRDRLVIGSNTYVVTDTTADESYPLCLSVSMRLRE